MKRILSIMLISTLFLVSCNNEENKEKPPVTEDNKCPICLNHPYAEEKENQALPQHSPTTFVESSVTFQALELAEGVTQTTWTYLKNNNTNAQVVTIEVDLDYASIAAGTADNQTNFLIKSTIYNQALFYEVHNADKSVVAATNADFFGGTTPVNAFVKDSLIIKDSHNDKGIYDYTNSSSDLPASKPMLFGISGKTAQIAPIITDGTVEETIKSKLFYSLERLRDETSSIITNKVVINKFNEKNNVNIIYDKTIEATAPADSTVIKMKRHEYNSTRIHGEILSIETVSTYTTYQPTLEEYYIVIPNSLELNDFEVGDILSYYINSKDNTWKYYDTIIGCRHSLVENGSIPSSLAKETSNGAKTTNVPRTAIGVLPNGNVVIFSVESLRYGKKSQSNSDPYGLNLNELTDFMLYYGVYSGANLDGGGSTQLITKNPTTEEFEVVVRSSDYGTYDLDASRSVINSLLVYTKRKY